MFYYRYDIHVPQAETVGRAPVTRVLTGKLRLITKLYRMLGLSRAGAASAIEPALLCHQAIRQ